MSNFIFHWKPPLPNVSVLEEPGSVSQPLPVTDMLPIFPHQVQTFGLKSPLSPTHSISLPFQEQRFIHKRTSTADNSFTCVYSDWYTNFHCWFLLGQSWNSLYASVCVCHSHTGTFLLQRIVVFLHSNYIRSALWFLICSAECRKDTFV